MLVKLDDLSIFQGTVGNKRTPNLTSRFSNLLQALITRAPWSSWPILDVSGKLGTIPWDLEDSGAPNSSPTSREIDHP